MTRRFFPGGHYCDALPSGEFCVLFYGSHVSTQLGPVTLPEGEEGPLFLRCSHVGGFKFAGQAHNSFGGYEWTQDGGWRAFGPPVCGVSPVIYDRAGALHVSDCAIGSQGYRFVDADNRIWTGDETYGSSFGLSEWSKADDVYIGQGHDGGGCLVNAGDGLRLLESGDCRFIRVHGDGDQVAISFVKPDGAVIVWTTLEELRALPRVSPPPPPIVTPPKPEPHPMPVNQLSTVQAVRAKYPTPLGAQHPAFLIEVARACGAKLLRKDAGSHITLPSGVNVSQDILMFGDQGVDILGDAEGAAIPAWQEKGTIAGEYIDVSAGPAPQPQPEPGPPPVDGELADRVAALEATVARLVQWTRGV